MKLCCHCGNSKEETEFRKHNGHKDGLQAWCKECEDKCKSDWYQRNKKLHMDRCHKCEIVRKRRTYSMILEYLQSHPCVDCGETDFLVLDFDHVRGKKVASISEIIWNAKRVDLLNEEIKKCEIRCANCHRRKTARERNTIRWKLHEEQSLMRQS